MVSEWSTYRIDEIATVKSGKRLPKDESLTDKKTSYPYIRLIDVNKGKIDASKIQYLEPKTQKKISRYIVETNDVCLAIVGHTIGMVFYVEDEWNKANLTENAARLTYISSSFNPRYIYYYLISPVGQSEIISRKVGSAQGKLPLYNIKELKIKAPDKITQDHIVDILLSLDNKITLNRQINQTLEQMAQTLFKSWFVDFDPAIDNALDAGFFEQDLAFSEELLRRVEVRKAVRESDNFKPLPEDIRQLFPDAFEECAEPALGVGGWMPKEWITTSLENVTSLIIDHRGKTPNKLGGEWSKKGYPAISAKNIKNGRLIRPDTIRYVDSKLYAKWMKDPLCAGDILMTSEAPVGELLYLVKDCEYLLSQRLYGIRANKEIISGSYLYFWLQTNIARADIDGRATGTTVVGIRQSELKQLKVMVPINAVVDVFSNLTDSYLKKAQSNEKQILELESLRDTLLPKLISGELSLSDVKIDNPEETLI